MRHWIAPCVLSLGVVSAQATSLDQQQAKALAQEAYVFAYATGEHNKLLSAISATLPFNQLYSTPKLLGPEDDKVVSPNNDTFYSHGLLDLRGEPQVLHVPAIDGRYYSFQLVDMRTNNLDYIGTRATGKQAGRYLIAGPDWQGKVPAGFNGVIRSPSRVLFILGRTEVKGEADQAIAAQVLKDYVLQPLSKVQGSTPPAPLAKPQIPVYRDSKQGAAVELFSRFNALASLHEWAPSEQQKLARYAQIGVVPGAQFNPPAMLREAIAAGAEAGREQIRVASSQISAEQQGWVMSPTRVGQFGDDDLSRAAVAWRYIYANDPIETIYPMAMRDAQGQVLNGRNSYRLHFAAGQLPPVDAFWSLTLYDGKTQLLVENPIQRYSLGDRSPALEYDVDGGLTLTLQRQAPASPNNWLPTPDGPFNLLLRLYLPQQRALDGRYPLPTIEIIKQGGA